MLLTLFSVGVNVTLHKRKKTYQIFFYITPHFHDLQIVVIDDSRMLFPKTFL